MKITVLMENTTMLPDLSVKHGLSLFIETNQFKILFDTGPNADFLQNAKKLKVNIEDVDIMVLSHGHYDHGGGIKAFLESNKKAKIYANKKVFGDYYSEVEQGVRKYIGLDKNLQKQNRFIYGDGDREIKEGILLFDHIPQKDYCSKANSILYKEEANNYINDNFLHEQNLVIKENKKNILIAGCAHSGIVNIINAIEERMGEKLDYVIGGFHLYSKIQKYCETKEYLNKLAKRLLETNIIFYTCHCTGTEQFQLLKEIMKDRIFYLSTGEKKEF